MTFLARWLREKWESRKAYWLWPLIEVALMLAFGALAGLAYIPFLGLFFAIFLLGVLIRPLHFFKERWYLDLFWVPVYTAGTTAPCFAFTLWLHSRDPEVRAGFPLDALGPFPVACVALFIGLSGIVTAAVFVVLNGFWRLRQLRQLENLPTSKVRSVAIGLAELRGVARSNGLIPEPILTVDPAAAKPFYLEDETGRILIDPAGARLRHWKWAHTFAPRICQIVLTRRTEGPFQRPRLELHDGDPVYLIGNVQRQGEGLVVRALEEKAHRGFLGRLAFGDRLRVSRRDIQHVFFLSDSNEEGALAHIRGGLFRLCLASAFWIASSFWMIGNQRPLVNDLAFRKWKIDMTATFAFPSAQSGFLMTQLEDPDPGIRRHVLDRIGHEWGPNSVEWVRPWARALGNPDPLVRARAAVILGRIHGEPSVSIPALLAALHDTDAQVVGDAAGAFNAFGEAAAPAVPRLVELIESDDIVIQRKAFWGLRSTRLTEAALPALLRQLNHPEPEIRCEALGCIGRVGAGAEATLDRLVAALKDEDGSVRDSAAAAIGDLGPGAARAVSALIEALGDRRNGDRLPTFAIRALGAIGPPAIGAIPAMLQTLDGGDDYRVSDVVSAISRMGGPGAQQRALPHLVEQLRSGKRSAQMAVSKCLGAMGPAARSAVPALEAMIASGVDGSVRAAAEAALAKIR